MACESAVIIGAQALPGYQYRWSPATTISTPETSQIEVLPTQTTRYTLQVQDDRGCQVQDAIVVVRSLIPSLPSELSLCPDEELKMPLRPEVGFRYHWTPASGLSDPEIANPVVQISQTQIYTVQIDDGHGCVLSDTVLVIPSEQKPVQTWPAILEICEGNWVELGPEPEFGATYEWRSGNQRLASTSKLRFLPDSSGTYTLTLTSPAGCNFIYSTHIQLIDSDIPAGWPVKIKGPVQVNRFQIGTDPKAGYQYSWSGAIDLNDPFKSQPVVTTQKTRDYVLTTTTSSNFCMRMDTVRVLIDDLPKINFLEEEFEICRGGRVQLGSNFYSDNLAFTWPNSVLLINSLDPQPWVSPNETTNFSLLVTDTLTGCQNRYGQTVVVSDGDAPVFMIPAADTLCANQPWVIPVNLEDSSGLTFQWAPARYFDHPEKGSSVVRIPSTQLVSLTVTNGQGCKSTREALLTVRTEEPVVYGGTDLVVCGLETQLSALSPRYSQGQWQPLTGPGVMDFQDAGDPTTSVRVSTPGDYLLSWKISGPVCNDGVSDTIRISFYQTDYLLPYSTVTVPLCSPDDLADLTDLLPGYRGNRTYWVNSENTLQLPDPEQVPLGIYYLTIGEESGCLQRLQIEVLYLEPADFSLCFDTTGLQSERVVYSCYEGFILLPLRVDTTCITRVRYGIDYQWNGIYDEFGEQADATGVHPVGRHRITWYLTDACLREFRYDYFFSVLPEPPHITSETIHYVNLEPSASGPGVEIKAKDLVNASSSCTGDQVMIFRITRNLGTGEFPETPSITLGCGDVGDTVLVELWAIDSRGGNDYVMVGLVASDSLGLCTGQALQLELILEQDRPFEVFKLHQNQPNPFTESTEIVLDIPTTSQARLEIMDVSGKVIWSIEEYFGSGRHRIAVGQSIFERGGIYFYRYLSARHQDVKRMILVE